MTTYSRLTPAPALSPGATVARGERLGAVESGQRNSGLFYQLLLNSRFIDPLRVRMPSIHRLDGGLLEAFRGERDRLRALATAARSYDLLASKLTAAHAAAADISQLEHSTPPVAEAEWTWHESAVGTARLA